MEEIDQPAVSIDEQVNKRKWLMQEVSNRLCGAHDNEEDFTSELQTVLDKYPINQKVEFNPSKFIPEES